MTRFRRSWLFPLLILALGACAGGGPASYEAVASQAIPHGVVTVLAPEGRLHTGCNEITVQVLGPAAERSTTPPRLSFEKPQGGSGFRVTAEARLRMLGSGRFAGEVDFPEPGSWNGRLELEGEVVAIAVAVE